MVSTGVRDELGIVERNGRRDHDLADSTRGKQTAMRFHDMTSAPSVQRIGGNHGAYFPPRNDDC